MTDNPRQSESTSWGSLLAGLVVGTMVGAAVSLLYAPRSGKETREALGARLDTMKTHLDDITRQVAAVAKTRLAETSADLAQAVAAGRTAAAERAAELRRQAGLE